VLFLNWGEDLSVTPNRRSRRACSSEIDTGQIDPISGEAYHALMEVTKTLSA
jgi:hypothetical protein